MAEIKQNTDDRSDISRPRNELAEDSISDLSTPELNSSDPFVDVYRDVQAKIAESHRNHESGPTPGEQPFLSRLYTQGFCGIGSSYAEQTLEKVYGVASDDLIPHEIGSLLRNLGVEVSTRHFFHYVKDGHNYLPAGDGTEPAEEFDLWFDTTSSQFSGQPLGERPLVWEIEDWPLDSVPDVADHALYRNLIEQDSSLGPKIVQDLYQRGYTKIPHSAEGERKLSLMVKCFAKCKDLPNPEIENLPLDTMHERTGAFTDAEGVYEDARAKVHWPD